MVSKSRGGPRLPPKKMSLQAQRAMRRILGEKENKPDTGEEPEHEDEDEEKIMEQTIKWVRIGTHEYVSKCGHFKARKRGTNWALFVRNDPGLEETYTDAEHTSGTFKAIKETCEALKAGEE